MSRFSRTAVAAGLFAALLQPSFALAQAQAPRCVGQDIAPELKERQPAEWARITQAADRTVNARAIFWRIDGPKGPPSHLFGTIHLTDDRINALPVAVQLMIFGEKHLQRRLLTSPMQLDPCERHESFLPDLAAAYIRY